MSKGGVTRRVFVRSAALGAAGLALGGNRALAQMMGGGGTGGGMGGGTVTVTDPPIGPALADPPVAPNLSATPGFVEVNIEARLADAVLNGAPARLLTYEGSFIAPTIKAKPGDRVTLRFKNGLPPTTELNMLGHPKNVTNVHVHGWHVSPGADMETGLPADDVHLQFQPGGEQTFRYNLEHQRPGTLALYHPHVHGTVAEQMWGGLVGALDVADGPDLTALASYPMRLLVLKDLTVTNGAPQPYTMMGEYMRGKEGSVVMVNAQVNPLLLVQPGQVRRFKILNASNARFYRLAFQGHAMHLVGTDGGLLDKPYQLSEILVSPGERVDVLVKAGATGDYKLLALPYARHGNMTSPQITLMTMRVKGSKLAQALPAAVNPAAVRLADDEMIPAERRPRFVLSMGQGRGYINGLTFDVVDGTIHSDERHSKVGTDEIWEVVNQSGMDHPWHQHVNDGQVLSIAGGDAAFSSYARLYTGVPGFKDTIIVPKWGSVTFRLPIRDFTGMTMYHCHILEHEDIGMMGMWHIMEGGMPM